MTRDEALKVWLPVIQMGVKTMPECKEALDLVMDTMRKYQKIEHIYERFQKDGNYYHHMAWLDVMEVLEDGNDKGRVTSLC